ncbi:hypothetical protein CC86DRAFT_192762 [Ophiobolus disseminans]|uniref:Uncharacterized protein n=1 Tax=Ophiobolus disseminans TaxID=1469910 RepID=A0A6A7A5F7_9PLEO|nr:hypothetical protein CC86DRAFT_192762 [Ophiobolus disseminans]
MLAIDSCSELLGDLNVDVEGTQQEPTFHGFTALPLEIRYQVYEEYFHSDEKSQACYKWPHNAEPCIYPWGRIDKHWKSSLPFLPSLCLVNRRISEEASLLLLRTAEVRIDNVHYLEHFVNRLASSSSLSLEQDSQVHLFYRSRLGVLRDRHGTNEYAQHGENEQEDARPCISNERNL